jgi:hypothetical protein
MQLDTQIDQSDSQQISQYPSNQLFQKLMEKFPLLERLFYIFN